MTKFERTLMSLYKDGRLSFWEASVLIILTTNGESANVLEGERLREAFWQMNEEV